ncbi:MAG: metallophosphoesterase [Nanoarchaeota archaeon]|nr:metallophosphoesterase [Nanoarchaeota archaeon]
MKSQFKLISKCIFFPKQGILAVGDLHIGYESMLRLQGIFLPFNQLETTKTELENIINKIRATSKLKKIVLLGDIKHHFAFEKSEIFELRNFLKFLEKFLPKKDIIMIQGNHDKFTLKDYTLRESYIEDDIAFFHGHETPKGIFDNKKIKTCVMGHIHPSVMLKDKTQIKREKYKAFFIGKFKSKKLIIVPSFIPLIEGSEIRDFHHPGKDKEFTIIKNTQFGNFDVFLVGKNKVYNFGKFKNLKR